ncbi:1,4-alpha-glucan-branching enzyme 3, chloroplastic/amyloplastic [Dorcoceras hygrometricum]|uniref:1,4-alpha-glucan-branching enzyme 3, chloroplastic/amyloplastic n=1 Tax=Dorcoceras hygrometricum TaxID=472368 RepID=A0A2Z7CUD3_9LAMI|nr:1,4-alpha-glucan-branching enzyme 3, chloroplastic/amyloplastic [Dorcoceras hygrometricum]
MQIQQRRKLSSDADFIFSTKIQISRREARLFVQESPPVEIRKDFSRVQGRIRTTEPQNFPHHFEIPSVRKATVLHAKSSAKILEDFLAKNPAQIVNLRRAPKLLLSDFTPASYANSRFVLPELTPDFHSWVPAFLVVPPRIYTFVLPESKFELEMTPSVPRTRAAAALRLAATKKELEETRVALEANNAPAPFDGDWEEEPEEEEIEDIPLGEGEIDDE